MARIKIELPERQLFRCKVVLRVSDMNYGNHMGNEVVLQLAHECRVLWLKQHQCTEMDVYGTGIIQADTAIVYHSEGYAGNEIEIRLLAGELSRVGFELYYDMQNLSTQKALARVKTGMVFYDYAASNVRPVPEQFRRIWDDV